MEKQEPKKAWVTPELIVLMRSKPEEAVLEGCKSSGAGGPEVEDNSRCINALGCLACVLFTAS